MVPEVRVVQDVPLVDVSIVPDNPTATKVLFPKATPRRVFEVPEVRLVQVSPSVDVSIVPLAPTATKVLLP